MVYELRSGEGALSFRALKRFVSRRSINGCLSVARFSASKVNYITREKWCTSHC
jgi:hypothetical protein